jgi:nucleoside phosphorylase
LELPTPAAGERWGERGIAWSGVGRRRTEATLEALAAAGVSEVVHLGCAGAIRPGLKAGDAFWIKSARCENEEFPALTLPDEDPLREVLDAAGHELPSAECVSVREVASSAEAKTALAGRYPEAALVEMETYWAAAAAQRLGLRLVALRVVIDAREHELPDMTPALDELGRPKPLAFAARLLRRPKTALALPGLASAFGAAQRELGRLASVLLQSP